MSEQTAPKRGTSDDSQDSDCGWIRCATRVITRYSRSRHYANEEVRERINRALAVIDQTRQSETAFLQEQPVSSAQRLATRIARRLKFKT